MTDTLSFVVIDNEAEECLLRNVDEFNEKFRDAKTWSEPKCKAMLTDEEMQRYIDLIPGSNLGSRRRAVINLVKDEDVEVPDLSDYTMTEFDWNEEIERLKNEQE